MPYALPMLAPPEDDNRRNALWRKPGCPDLGEDAGGGGDVISGLMISLAPGVKAAPKGFDCSNEGLRAGLPPAFCVGAGSVDARFELDENLELMLVIQELRLPKEGGLGSLAFLAAVVEGEVVFSGLKRE